MNEKAGLDARRIEKGSDETGAQGMGGVDTAVLGNQTNKHTGRDEGSRKTKSPRGKLGLARGQASQLRKVASNKDSLWIAK